MAIQTLYTAATGMISLESKLDVIANNLANMETTGFKRGRANFEDLFYRTEQMPGTQDSAGEYTPVGIQTGLGARVTSTQADVYTPGAIELTGRELDVAIQGNGYFQVMDPSGDTYYTRAGNFSRNANGNLVAGSAQTGRLLEPPISIPSDTLAVSITAEGEVSVRLPNNNTLQPVGTIQLARFINPEGLLALGENLFAETDASGPPTTGNPGQDGLGVLRQNSLEGSNVEPVTEIIDLITTQRAFEMNSKAIQTGDELLQTVANLKRY